MLRRGPRNGSQGTDGACVEQVRIVELPVAAEHLVRPLPGERDRHMLADRLEQQVQGDVRVGHVGVCG